MNNKKSGFTLIELVVILVLLGILMAVAMPLYVDLTSSAKKTADVSFADNLRAACTLYMATNALSNGVVNPAGTYFPSNNFFKTNTSKTIILPASYSRMMTLTNYTLRYYTIIYYNQTNGSVSLR